MKRSRLILPALLLCVFLNGCGGGTSTSHSAPPLPNVPAALSYNDFFSSVAPATPVLDAAFAMPTGAAAPADTFEGRLDLVNPAGNGIIYFPIFQRRGRVHNRCHRGRTSSIHSKIRAFQIEYVSHASGNHVGQLARQRIFRDIR